MSFTKILFNMLVPRKITITLADIPTWIQIATDISNGKYAEVVEAKEFAKAGKLAQHIDQHVELLPLLIDLLKDKKHGREVKDALLEHRVLVHALFYNKQYVIKQLSNLIDELENQVLLQEFTHQQQGYKIATPAVARKQ
jgi:hypothetical protein